MDIAAPLTPPLPPRLARLDGLRGLAACMVAFPYHARILFDPAVFAHGRYGPVVDWLQAWGWTFVDLFFVLSGYVFAHVYLGRDGLKTRVDLAVFAVARVARLYPLHLVMLLATAAFVYGTPNNGAVPFVANLAMLQAFLRPFAESFDSPSWSLSVETFCYVLFAAGALAGRRVLLALTVFMIALSAFRLGWLGLAGGPYVSDVVPRGLLGFFAGQSLWHGRAALARVPTLVLGLALAGGIACASGPVSPLIPLTLVAWPAALLLALRLRVLESRAMLWLGDRSYAIYLVNLPIIWAVGHLLGPLRGSAWQVFGVNALIVVMVLAASDLSLRLIERPGRTWVRHAISSPLSSPLPAATSRA